MPSINPFSRFSDPYISPETFITPSPISSPEEIQAPSASEIGVGNITTPTPPIIVKTISDLPDESIIVYRGTPTGFARGPNVAIPFLNFDINNSTSNSKIFATCTSTYPEAQPYNPIADRYEVRLFRDGWILTLADGCGLKPSSRLAPAAAMKGFWEHLTERLRNDQEGFKVQKLAQYLYEAIEAGHFNIYWDAFLRNHEEGYSAYKNQVISNLREIQANSQQLSAEQLERHQGDITSELNSMISALKGDSSSQRKLVNSHLENRFYENYAGATTFMCSALIKSGASSETPFYLLSVSLGDCKGFLFKNGVITEVTSDTREDLSNARDPGGKIGLCTPLPLLVDNRNLQYSLTPCSHGDILFFMTDGVVDNLDPERLGLLPNAKESPESILTKIRESASLDQDEFDALLDNLQINAQSWKLVALEQANQAKALFGRKLLEKIINSAGDASIANEKIVQYCKNITSDYRDEKPHFSNLFEQSHSPIGKPDHTTCLTIEVQ
ncbi:MAG: hypothetical protein S4CHLAM6_08730 [Chlamydiae bacterium]|nr:hypothetical protein [Chlamydiota bacterium]